MKKLLTHPITYCSLFFLTIGSMAFIPYQKPETKDPSITLKKSEVEAIIQLSNQSINEGAKIDCWTVKQQSDILTPNVQIVNFLKTKLQDTVSVKK